MNSFTKLKSGIYVYSYKGVDGVCRIKVLDKNTAYKFNVWWSKLKAHLMSKSIFTNKNFCKVCGTDLTIECEDNSEDYSHNYCSLSCYKSRYFDL